MDGLLLLLERIDHFLLFHLFVFQSLLLLFIAIQQIILLSLGVGQLLQRLRHHLLHGLHSFTLCPLVNRIFAHETHTTVHLCKVVGTEDKHQTLMDAPIAMHIAHRIHITLLPVFQFFFKHLQLIVENMHITIKCCNIPTDRVNNLALVINLSVDHHQVLQTSLDILLGLTKPSLLLFHLFLQLLALVLQPLHGYRRLFARLLLSGCFFGGPLRYSPRCSCLLLHRLFLLCRKRHHKT